MDIIVYKIKKDETLNSVAKKFCVNTSAIFPQKFERGDRVVIRLKSKKLYIVKPGDTLPSIAANLGISTEELIKTNGSKTIFVGKHLFI